MKKDLLSLILLFLLIGGLLSLDDRLPGGVRTQVAAPDRTGQPPAIGIGLGLSPPALIEYEVIELGVPAGLPASDDVFGVALSNGVLPTAVEVVGYSLAAGGDRASPFRWSWSSGISEVLDIPFSLSGAYVEDIGPTGGPIVGFTNLPFRAFAWEDDDEVLQIDGDNSRAHGTNEVGDSGETWVVGSTRAFASTTRGFVYRRETGEFTSIGLLPGGTQSWAIKVNRHGQVACNSTGVLQRACLWRAGEMLDLGVLPGLAHSNVRGLNDLGHVVGSSYVPPPHDPVTRGFIWRDGVMEDLGQLPGTGRTTPHAINNRDEVVGESSEQAFLWRNGAMINLNQYLPAGSPWAVLAVARDINDHGLIVGTGVLSNGKRRPFLMSPLQ